MPELRDDVSGVLARLRDLHDRLTPRAPAPAHGAGFGPDPGRCATYRVDVRLRKVARTAMAVRPDGDVRSARHLRAVVEALQAAE